ncbi:MAG TPA: hypothetical protein VK837_05415 [Longimicrobiales bacterium]|nr:hypothetical protein [Longimicrobiales bacterium]
MGAGRPPGVRRAYTGALVVVALATAAGALLATRGDAPGVPAVAAPAPARASADTGFAALVERLSGEGAYFDTDNLISNEASYLHVAARLRAARAPGLAYIGVGPDQNFSYIAALRPEAAFILDIRRDNLLHHLLLKALMEAAPDRASYAAALFGRPAPPARLRRQSAPLVEILDWVERTPPDTSAALPPGLRERVEGFGLELSSEDLETIARFHRTFIAEGPGLRFRSHGRAPRWYYPTYRDLLLERDETGAPASYLASEDDYLFVRDLQRADRVVPVVGDFAGPHALRAIGREIAARGLELGAFYTSNVEFYLERDGSFERYVASLETLPAAPDGVIVRSYFHRGRPHAETRPGYASTQLVQPIETFVEGWRAGAYPTYRALVGSR